MDDDEAWKAVLALTVAALILGGFWHAGSNGGEGYEGLDRWEMIGRVIGDTIRGIGVVWNNVKSSIANWLGF